MKIPKEKKVQATTIPVNPKEVILLEKRVLHRVHTIHTAILIHPGETIPMMFIIIMIRMILQMTGQKNSEMVVMMMGMMMRMIIGRVKGINTETIIGTGWKETTCPLLYKCLL